MICIEKYIKKNKKNKKIIFFTMIKMKSGRKSARKSARKHVRSNPKSHKTCDDAGMKWVPGHKAKGKKRSLSGYCRKGHNKK